MADITTDELKSAYRRSRLSLLGISFQNAIDTPVLLKALRLSAVAHRKKFNLPAQGSLIN